MRRVTIKDIARIAGVSYATVSRALSGSHEISEETRARVLDICREQGYRVNTLARSLISNKTNVIGLIIPDISNPFYAEIALNLETHARKHGYNVMLCNSMHSGQETESLFEFLIGHRVDGVVLASSRDNARLWAAHYRDKVPTVLLSDCLGTDVLDHDAINSVSLNNRLGGSMGVEYLYGLGHRDILYFGMRPNSITHQRRYQGYQNAMQEHGLTPTVVENPRDTSSISAGYTMAKELFLGGHTCTAIFAATDSIAIGVFQAADEFGIEIPGDISLLGFDNITYSGLPKIQLCTIDQRKPQLAEASVDLLLHLIDNADDGEYTHRVIRPALVERASCAPPRSAK